MHPKVLIPLPGFMLLAALWAGPAWTEGKPDCLFGCPGDGPKYRDALVVAIDRADRIVVTEHSSPSDSFDTKVMRSRIQSEFEYARVELEGAQRQRFREIMLALDPKTQNWASACIPAFHHTVRFYEKDSPSSTFEICFACDQVAWDGVEGISPPGAIYGGLREFIADIGMQPKRDWGALAHERLRALQATPAVPK